MATKETKLVYILHVIYKYTNCHVTLDLVITKKSNTKEKICDLISVTMEIGPHCVYSIRKFS